MNDADHHLDEVLLQIREQEVPAYPRPSIDARLDAMRNVRAGDGEVARASRWDRAWQWLTVGALAAGLLVGAFLMFSAIDSGKALAFAEMQQAVAAKQTMRYRILAYSNDPGYLAQYEVKAGEPTVTEVISSGNRIRKEQPLGMVIIEDYDTGVVMIVTPRRVSAEISPIYETEETKQYQAFRAMLRNVSESSAKRLPDRELDGRRVNEFLVQMHEQDYTFTVDPKTKLPIRMEVQQKNRPEIGQGENRMVFTDFEFDVHVDESLFRMEAPEGYTVSNRVPRNKEPQPPESIELVLSPENGIGPVRFGMNVAEIVRLLGEPDWREGEEGTQLGYDRRGFRLMVHSKLGGLHEILCFNKHGIASTKTGFRGKTKEGIALGASLDDVLKTYGKPDAQLDSIVFYRKRGYEFWFRDKKLVSIHVRRPNPNARLEVKGDGYIER
jgi:outer membrane lipoprotein-sorting protein